jgi:hypothetical protein
MPISAWNDYAKIDSPNGRYSAIYDQAMEVAMGAPTLGILSICDNTTGECLVKFSEANGSFVWASDSTAIAFPKWRRSGWAQGWIQHLTIVRLPSCKTVFLDNEYKVLELDSFHGDVIKGIDSPLHNPARVSVSAHS